MRKVMQIQLHTLCTQVYAVRQSAAVLMLLGSFFLSPETPPSNGRLSPSYYNTQGEDTIRLHRSGSEY